MATKSAGFGGSGPLSQTQTLILTKGGTAAEKVEQRDIARKPITLYGILADNQGQATNATLVYIKVYDNISNGWSPGAGEKALLGFPVEKLAGALTDTTPLQLLGTYQFIHSRTGIPFEKGISVAAAQEAGDTMTNSPHADADVALEVIHN